MLYRNTQRGLVVQFSCGFATVFSFLICMFVGFTEGMPWWAWLIAIDATAFLALMTWFFGSMTVEVDEKELRHWFGPGIWRKSYSLNEVESVERVLNKWWYGWGIRYTPHGWLYNVSGLDAIELKPCSGKKIRIGTDQPVELLEAIQESIAE